jgi:hypothetical protein
MFVAHSKTPLKARSSGITTSFEFTAPCAILPDCVKKGRHRREPGAEPVARPAPGEDRREPEAEEGEREHVREEEDEREHAEDDPLVPEHPLAPLVLELVEEADGRRERPEHDRDTEEERQEPHDEHDVHEERDGEDGEPLVLADCEAQRANRQRRPRQVHAQQQNVRRGDAGHVRDEAAEHVVEEVLRPAEREVEVLVDAELGVVEAVDHADRRHVNRHVLERRIPHDPRRRRREDREREIEQRGEIRARKAHEDEEGAYTNPGPRGAIDRHGV